MQDLGIGNTAAFSLRLEEEQEYLRGLSKEPICETEEMEYYQRLANLSANE